MTTPEFTRLNTLRVHEGLEPLPDDTALDATLRERGITHCFDKPYWWFGVIERPSVVPKK